MEPPAVEAFQYRDKEQSSDLLLQLNALRREGILTDVSLCSGSAEIPCHRNVLVSSSPYFRAMFCGSFAERRQSKVTLKGVASAVLSSVVDYIYTGLATITMETVLPLMQAASMLQYGRLFEACSSYLQDQLSPDNCLSMMRLSDIMNCDSLRRTAKEMAMERFSDISGSEDLRELSLPELLGYLGDDGLCAGEEQVFETLVSWVYHDPFSRRGAVGDLFKKVRLRHIHPTYLFQFIANDPLILSSTLCTELIESVRRLMFSVNAKCSSDQSGDFGPVWVAPRRYACRDMLVVVGGRKNGERTSREALVYDEKTGKWGRLAKAPARLYKASYVALHGVLYALGGLSTDAGRARVSASVYTISLKANRWRAAEPMLLPRFAHQSVAYLHFVFVLGGFGPDRRLSSSAER